MSTRRAKSTCCRAIVQRFGGRRRRCRGCGRTWRVRPCRRGRRARRPTLALLQHTLLGGQSLASQAARLRCAPATLRRRFRQALQWFLPHSSPPAVPPGPLVLMADAVWFRFDRRRWTLYLLAAKPLGTATAIVRDPLLLPGKEALAGWRAAVTRLVPDEQHRVVAFVSDGFPGSQTLAQRAGWVQQRCHFHLIAKLQARRGRRKRLPGWQRREAIYQTIREALETRSRVRLGQLCRRLRRLAGHPACPARLRMTTVDFLRERHAFRAFLEHPELELPTTTNALEAMAKILRARLRPLKTPASLQCWATALIRLRPRVTCHSHGFQPN